MNLDRKGHKKTMTAIYPEYAERELRLILRFLAAMTLDTTNGIRRLIEFYGEDANSKIGKNHIDAYRRELLMIRKYARRASQRQRHLLEMDEYTFGEVILTWRLPRKTLLKLGLVDS